MANRMDVSDAVRVLRRKAELVYASGFFVLSRGIEEAAYTSERSDGLRYLSSFVVSDKWIRQNREEFLTYAPKSSIIRMIRKMRCSNNKLHVPG